LLWHSLKVGLGNNCPTIRAPSNKLYCERVRERERGESAAARGNALETLLFLLSSESFLRSPVANLADANCPQPNLAFQQRRITIQFVCYKISYKAFSICYEMTAVVEFGFCSLAICSNRIISFSWGVKFNRFCSSKIINAVGLKNNVNKMLNWTIIFEDKNFLPCYFQRWQN